MFFRKQKQANNRPQPRQRQRVAEPVRRGPVFSYRANRSLRIEGESDERITPEKAAKTRSRQVRLEWLKRTPNLLLSLAVLMVVLYSLHLNSGAVIVPTADNDHAIFLRNIDVYETAAKRAFGKSLTNNNKVTVNAAQVVRDLRSEFPELKAVAVSLPFVGNSPTVYIQPATPALILVSASGIPMVVDTGGKALIAGDMVSNLNKLKLPTVTDESGLPAEVGRVVLPSTVVGFIREVTGQLQAKGLQIESLALPNGLSQLDVRLKGQGYYTKYNLQGNGREQAGAYLALKTHMEGQHVTPREYVDVRVEGKGYYK